MFALTDVSILTKTLFINVPARGKSVQQHRQKIKNFPEDKRVSKASDNAGFFRKVSRGQGFVTIHEIELAGLGCAGSCRELKDPNRQDGFGEIQ